VKSAKGDNGNLCAGADHQ
ncbi:unnamed protein product, partial [Allacma fusca]